MNKKIEHKEKCSNCNTEKTKLHRRFNIFSEFEFLCSDCFQKLQKAKKKFSNKMKFKEGDHIYVREPSEQYSNLLNRRARIVDIERLHFFGYGWVNFYLLDIENEWFSENQLEFC